MTIETLWTPINRLAQKWDCEVSEILHLAETGQLKACINWQRLATFIDGKSGYSDFFFRHSDYPSSLGFRDGEVTDKEILFSDAPPHFHPYGNEPLASLVTVSNQLIEKLIAQSPCYFDYYYKDRKNDPEDRHYNTTLFLKDKELVVRWISEELLSISISDLVFTQHEIARYEGSAATSIEQESKIEQDLRLTQIALVAFIKETYSQSPKFQHGTKPNVSKIVEKLLTSFGDKKPHGFGKTNLTNGINSAINEYWIKIQDS